MTDVQRRPLNRARVLGAALELIDADGLEALSMRRLGAALGVEAMSLYNHVASKDDLLGGVADLLLEMVEIPESSDDWRVDVRQLCSAVRAVGMAHPQAFPLLATQSRVSLASWRPITAGYEFVRRAGLAGHRAVAAVDALASYLVGFVLFEVTAAAAHSLVGGMHADLTGVDEALQHFFAARSGLEPTSGFELALDFIIDGIGAAIGT